MLRSFFACTALALCPLVAMAQKQATDYPQDYFRKPVDIPIYLAGNFGECRPGHFHSGIDIKTDGKENLPVRAAADGYISRIKMERGGFGHALYITHEGYTTLYAHLNDFSPAIQAYLRSEQYKRQKWDVDLTLSPNQFPVSKGDQIAFSGNTGASTAPHLHFEIRDSKTEHPLNPQLFGLQIEDRISPMLKEVAFYYGNVLEEAGTTVPLAKKGLTYAPVRGRDSITIPSTTAGIGFNADDLMDGSDNTLTFYIARLYLDDSLQAQVTLDDIGYDETRYINAYTDFKTKELQRKWVQLMFQQPGNRLGHIYEGLNSNAGRIVLRDKNYHKLILQLTDAAGNTTSAQLYVRSNGYSGNGNKDNCNTFYANKTNEFSDQGIAFTLDERQLYDNICFNYRTVTDASGWSAKHTLHYPYIPLHHYFDLNIKPTRAIPAELKDKVVMLHADGKGTEGRAASLNGNGWYKASVREFGTYWLGIDTVAPVIKLVKGARTAQQFTFEVKDAGTSVKKFAGYVDGKWVCFEQHGNLFFYKYDEHCKPGRHKMLFRAEDENGNVSTQQHTFIR